MKLDQLNVLLSDDDFDDCSFFEKALKEIPIATNLTIVHDGDELMNYLNINSEHLPDVLFLDLSMPRKNGFECLTEIKESEKLEDLVVVMFSTSFPQNIIYEENMIDLLMKIGAHDYIRKSCDFTLLKQIIHSTLKMVADKNTIKGNDEIMDKHIQTGNDIFESNI